MQQRDAKDEIPNQTRHQCNFQQDQNLKASKKETYGFDHLPRYYRARGVWNDNWP
jgi:hypothetical protein